MIKPYAYIYRNSKKRTKESNITNVTNININRVYDDIIDTAEFDTLLGADLYIGDYISIYFGQLNLSDVAKSKGVIGGLTGVKVLRKQATHRPPTKVFEGYIVKIEVNNRNKTIHLEDMGHILKYIEIKPLQYKNTSIYDILKYCNGFNEGNYKVIKELNNSEYVKEYKPLHKTTDDKTFNSQINTAYVDFTIAKGTTYYEMLNKLKSDFSFNVKIHNNEIVLSMPYVHRDKTETDNIKYSYGKNIFESSLTKVYEGETKLKITYKGWDKDNKYINGSHGFSGGTEKDYHSFNVKTAEGLEKLAEDKYNSYVWEGLEGSFTTMLFPLVSVGDAVTIDDNGITDKDSDLAKTSILNNYDFENKHTIEGIYFCSGTALTFDENGMWREVSLTKQLA